MTLHFHLKNDMFQPPFGAAVFKNKKHLAKNEILWYTYDKLSRVITKRTQNTVTGRETVENFSYDAAGNLLTDESMGQEYVYDTNNRLISTSECINVTYDADGNMTYTLLDGELTYLEYDSTNKLISAGNCQYTYNGENVRIRNLCGTSETKYVYDTNARLSRLLQKTTDGIITKYVYGRGLIGEESDNSFKTYHYDYRGSTVAITDMNGNVTDTFAYDTYGRLVSRTGTNKVIFLYNGRDGVVTDDNGLLYMRARYYCPELRRFVNSDVIVGEISNAVTLNRYAYANGNPVSNVDPFGLSAERSCSSLWDSIKNVGTSITAGIKGVFNWSVNTFKQWTAEGKLDTIVDFAIGANKDKNGIYHIDQDYWQSIHFVGYNGLYDWVFDVGTRMTGTSMAADKFDFCVDGTWYTIWVWKGDYINLGSGAEAGIYKESVIPGHWLTSPESAMPMSLSLKEKDSGNVLYNYRPKENQWWITGFDPSHQNAQAANLEVTVTVDFSKNPDLYRGFYATYGPENHKSPWEFDGYTATLTW